MRTFKVRNESGQAFDVDEDKLKDAEADGFLPIVSNGKNEHRVSPADLGTAEKDGYSPMLATVEPEKGLLDYVSDAKNTFNDFSRGVSEGVPGYGLIQKAGSAAAAGLAKIYDDRPYSEIYKETLQRDMEDDRAAGARSPIANTAGNFLGSVTAPSIKGAPGIKGVAQRIAGNAAIGAADMGTRSKDLFDEDRAAEGGGLAAAISGAVEAIPYAGKPLGYLRKKAGNIVFGVGDKATEKYLQNPAAIKNAKPLAGVTKEFLEKVDDIAQDTSMQSGASFMELGKHSGSVTDLLNPLKESVEELKAPLIGKGRKSAVTFLEGIADDIANHADENGNVSLDIGKHAIVELDDEITRVQNIGGTAAIKALTNARKNLDKLLKTASPKYKDQMSDLAQDTKAFVDIGGRFRSEGGAEKLLNRISRGKDHFNKEALQRFDDRFSTDFGKELETSYLANQFNRDTTNGSRRTLLGTAVGGVVGSMVGGPMGAGIGGAAGAAAGASIDKLGGQIWQKILDGSLKVGPYAKVLEKAAQSGPGQVGVMHYFLLENYPDYREKVEAGEQ